MVTRLPGASSFGASADFYMVVNGATKEGDIAHLREKLPAGVALEHLEDQALVALQGPKAVEALSAVAPGVEDLTFMTGGAFEIGGVPAWISRSGYTGEDGFEISIPAASAAEVAELLTGQPEVKPIGLGARDSLRLEAGLPLYGHDLDTGTTPIEADLGFAISKRRRAEGGFPGAFRIGREMDQGVIRRRVGLAFSAASRSAKARWWWTRKAMKSARSPAAASRRCWRRRSPWPMSPPPRPSRARR
jgi:aminomethyltransferase